MVFSLDLKRKENFSFSPQQNLQAHLEKGKRLEKTMADTKLRISAKTFYLDFLKLRSRKYLLGSNIKFL